MTHDSAANGQARLSADPRFAAVAEQLIGSPRPW
jgi:hypothetical protein